MTKHWTQTELNDNWKLSREEILSINNKSKQHRLVYAVKMKFLDMHGYIPTDYYDIPDEVVNFIYSQITSNVSSVKKYNWNGRTSQQHNNEIRKFYGYKKCNKSYWKNVKKYLQNNSFSQGETFIQSKENTYLYLKNNQIEPPSKKALERKVKSTVATYESNFFEQCAKGISITGKKNLKKLLKCDNSGKTALNFLRKVPGRISKDTIKEELSKLEYVEKSSILYKYLFTSVSRQLVQKYHDKVSFMTPSALSKLHDENENKFYTMLACFCKHKGSKIIDNIAEIFIRRFHRVQKTAQSRAKNDLFDYYVKSDKEKLLNELVDISLKYPVGIIEEEIYTGVGGKEVLETSKATRSTFKHHNKTLEYQHMSALYLSHHRKYFLLILEKMRMHSNTDNPKLLVIKDILKHYEKKDYHFDPKFIKRVKRSF